MLITVLLQFTGHTHERNKHILYDDDVEIGTRVNIETGNIGYISRTFKSKVELPIGTAFAYKWMKPDDCIRSRVERSFQF